MRFGSYWIPGSYVTSNSMSACSNALPRFLTLCTNAKQPRESESFSCAMPRWGRSQLRHSDQKPSIVYPWTSHKPSPSSSRAYAPRPWCTRFCSSPQAHQRADRLSASLYTSVPGAMVSLMNGSMVFCFIFASLLITTGPHRGILPKTGGFSCAHVPRPHGPWRRCRRPVRPLVFTTAGCP